ncbi:MAG: hypothetical protein ACRCSK_06415 [Fusobacteriaceae bacterium]
MVKINMTKNNNNNYIKFIKIKLILILFATFIFISKNLLAVYDSLMNIESNNQKGQIMIDDRYYGDNQNKNLNYGTGNNINRFQVSGFSQTFENQVIKFWIRKYSENNNMRKEGYDNRFEYIFKHGQIGESGIGTGTNIIYRSYFKNDEYFIGEKFYFAEYLPIFDYFSLAPYLQHILYADTNNAYENSLGLYLEFGKERKWYDFYVKLTGYKTFYSNAAEPYLLPEMSEKVINNFIFSIEAYYTQVFFQQTFEHWGYKIKAEFGIDPFEYNKESVRWNTSFDAAASSSVYSAFTRPYLEVTGKILDDFQIIGEVGAEYRNWRDIEYDKTGNWSWQPQIMLGIKYLW